MARLHRNHRARDRAFHRRFGAAQLTAADAGAFMGSWSLALDSPQGTFEQSLVLKDEAGKVVAEISNQMQPEVQKVTDVSKKGSDLVLKFAGNFQGNPFDAEITWRRTAPTSAR